MSDPLDGPITGKQMAQLLRELREDAASDLDARFTAQDERIRRQFAEQTSELEAVIQSAVKGSESNVKQHLDKRLDDLAERVDRLEGGGEDPYRAPTGNDLG